MFGISVSGIKNSQKHIDVTSNNIANTNSYGFKKSRAEFADVYTNSIFTNSRTSTGMGVNNTVVSQQFAQGALSGDTGNPLDMAIQGNGFFVLSNGDGSLSHTYTRNGAFQINREGYITTATGEFLQGWDVNPDGSASSLDLGSTHNILIPEDTGAPKQSSEIGIGVNLPADRDPITTTNPANDPWTGAQWNPALPADFNTNFGIPRDADGNALDPADPDSYTNADIIQYNTQFNPKDPSTYTATTSQTVHDSLGRAHTLTYYLFNMGPKGTEGDDANTNVWTAIPYLDGKPVDVNAVAGEQSTAMTVTDGPLKGANFFGFRLEFDSSGELIGDKTIPGDITFVNGDKADANLTGINDLRKHLFGIKNEADNSGTLAITDSTFEGGVDSGASLPYDNADGSLHTAMGTGINPDQVLHLSFSATQYGSSNFEVTGSPTNDGYSTGILTGISVDENGIIQAEYSNGSIEMVAKVALADFTNQQGLTKVGDSQWKESIYSGAAQAKQANSGSAGSIKGSNLELSNVDLTSELVELITAQRNYQANAQSLQTQNTVMDSILNIR